MCRKAQLRLRAPHATSFSCRLTSFRRKADTSEVARSANDVGLRSMELRFAQMKLATPNDVGLRPMKLRSAQMKMATPNGVGLRPTELRFAQTEAQSFDSAHK